MSQTTTDVEAPLRAETMRALAPWFSVLEEVPVRLRDGRTGRVDVLAAPKDSRFSQFTFAIEEKNVRKLTDRLAARIRQAADYVGSVDLRTGSQITMIFLDLKGFEGAPAGDQNECRVMMRVAHQFFVGSLYDGEKGLRLSSGPDDIWRERPFYETGDNWPGRALERLTNMRQSAGGRGHAA